MCILRFILGGTKWLYVDSIGGFAGFTCHVETLVMFWDKPWQNSLPHGDLVRLIVLLSGIDPFHGTRTNTLYPQYYDTVLYDILSLFPKLFKFKTLSII
jgi:hypothetical protein